MQHDGSPTCSPTDALLEQPSAPSTAPTLAGSRAAPLPAQPTKEGAEAAVEEQGSSPVARQGSSAILSGLFGETVSEASPPTEEAPLSGESEAPPSPERTQPEGALSLETATASNGFASVHLAGKLLDYPRPRVAFGPSCNLAGELSSASSDLREAHRASSVPEESAERREGSCSSPTKVKGDGKCLESGRCDSGDSGAVPSPDDARSGAPAGSAAGSPSRNPLQKWDWAAKKAAAGSAKEVLAQTQSLGALVAAAKAQKRLVAAEVVVVPAPQLNSRMSKVQRANPAATPPFRPSAAAPSSAATPAPCHRAPCLPPLPPPPPTCAELHRGDGFEAILPLPQLPPRRDFSHARHLQACTRAYCVCILCVCACTICTCTPCTCNMHLYNMHPCACTCTQYAPCTCTICTCAPVRMHVYTVRTHTRCTTCIMHTPYSAPPCITIIMHLHHHAPAPRSVPGASPPTYGLHGAPCPPPNLQAPAEPQLQREPPERVGGGV